MHYRSILLPFESLRPRGLGPLRRDLIHGNLLGRIFSSTAFHRKTMTACGPGQGGGKTRVEVPPCGLPCAESLGRENLPREKAGS